MTKEIRKMLEMEIKDILMEPLKIGAVTRRIISLIENYEEYLAKERERARMESQRSL